MNNRLLLSFYGDDFTGSTDAMEALSLAGVRTVLFFAPPDRLADEFGDVQAVGVAGISRTMSPAQMDAALPPIFEKIKRLGAPIFHYKVCSTFDSSPETGSIGRAIDIGVKIFDTDAARFVPLVVGAPILKRYTLFGNLFATVGAETYRIDRHPTMSCHPVTPMREGDLRVHLARQTAKKIALMDILNLSGANEEVDRNLARALEARPDVMLFDVLDAERLGQVGRLIWERARAANPLFVAGSSGVEYALVEHWRAAGNLSAQPTAPIRAPAAARQVIVMSGSCSPVTAGQITWSLERGYVGLKLDAHKLVGAEEEAAAERASIVERSLEVLARGANLLLYSAHGALGANDGSAAAAGGRLGAQQGRILRDLLERTGVRRVVVAGGDTSGHVLGQLDVYALEMIAPVAPGSPLCRAHSRRAEFNELQMALKGGQVGREDYFERVRLGST